MNSCEQFCSLFPPQSLCARHSNEFGSEHFDTAYPLPSLHNGCLGDSVRLLALLLSHIPSVIPDINGPSNVLFYLFCKTGGEDWLILASWSESLWNALGASRYRWLESGRLSVDDRMPLDLPNSCLSNRRARIWERHLAMYGQKRIKNQKKHTLKLLVQIRRR